MQAVLQPKELPVRPLLLFAAFAAAVIAVSAAAAAPASSMKPAIETKSNIGTVIATPMRLGIYYWDVEKKAGGKIKCTGACMKQWPPVYVTGIVPKHLTGVMATFGTVKRGVKRQLTVNGLPAYTYSGDRAGVVKCDGVDGWHAARPM
jgi:predicted lipoprotein with Yx(FWY)xxD motif